MRIKLVVTTLILCLASCNSRTETSPGKSKASTFFSIGSNQVISDEQNGLKLMAIAEPIDTTVEKGVNVKVVFTNTSTNQIVLLNHFDMCAVGPYFGFRQYSASLPNGHVDHYFKNSVSVNKAEKPWIEIEPGQSHVFLSPVSFGAATPLKIGTHTFRVIYFTSLGGGWGWIAKEKDVPKNLWRGDIMSEPLKIVVRE